MGVVPKSGRVEPVIIREKPPVDWSQFGMAGVVVALIVALVALRFVRQHTSPTTQEVAAQDRRIYVPPMASFLQTPRPNPNPSLMLASTPTQTVVTDTPSDDTADDETDDDIPDVPEDDIAPVPAAVVIGSAEVGSENDGDGHEVAYGHIQVINPSSYPITSLTILMATSGGSYPLAPISGSANSPIPLENVSIPAGGSLDIPVMSDGMYSSLDPTTPKTITVQATEDGTVVSSSTVIE